jgi:hypothetical protein
VASAWIAAVRAHAGHDRDRPVAIAFGTDEAEARHVLQQANLLEIMAMPLLSADPVVHVRL